MFFCGYVCIFPFTINYFVDYAAHHSPNKNSIITASVVQHSIHSIRFVSVLDLQRKSQKHIHVACSVIQSYFPSFVFFMVSDFICIGSMYWQSQYFFARMLREWVQGKCYWTWNNSEIVSFTMVIRLGFNTKICMRVCMFASNRFVVAVVAIFSSRNLDHRIKPTRRRDETKWKLCGMSIVHASACIIYCSVLYTRTHTQTETGANSIQAKRCKIFPCAHSHN